MMRNIIAAILCMLPLWMSAQTYPEKEDGAVVYYRIQSAYKPYEENWLYLYDNYYSKNEFPFALKGYDGADKLQDWVLQAVEPSQETYLLRNRGTLRYVSISGTWIEGFHIMNYTTKKSTANAFQIMDLGEGQVAIMYQGDDGLRYLTPCDRESDTTDIPDTELRNSIYAWRIQRTAELANTILSPKDDEGHYVVEGNRILPIRDTYVEIYDILGRRMSCGSPLSKGAYIVRSGRKVNKVLTK